MRPIPANILNKLKKLRQTRAEDADPRINLVLQRTRRYIEQGTSLNPFGLWARPGLGPLAMAIRREDHLHAPDKLFLIFVDNGQAHVAWLDYVQSVEERYDWKHLYHVGPAADVAIEFNGHWERTSPEADICFDSPARWSLVTEGEPYIFRVLPSGALVVQQGQDGGVVTLAESGVTAVSAIRAWKNVYRWNHDQGLLVAYIRNGQVCYRNWANQGTEGAPMPPSWEVERIVTELPYPAQSVFTFRTNDYRAGIIAESAGELHWVITDRNWAGMAIPDHRITARVSDLKFNFFELTKHSPVTLHIITAAAQMEALALLWAMPDNAFRAAENDENLTVYATCKYFLTELDADDFVILDDDGQPFDVSAVDTVGGDPYRLVMTVADLNFANQSGQGQGDLTLHFLGIGDTRGEAGQAVDPFEITFVPEGLEFEGSGAPEVEAIWNE